MTKGKRKSIATVQSKPKKELTVNSQPWSARNLVRQDLAGLIFACKKTTFKECFSKKLFGLPGAHISYVQKVTPGMPLFLFNCTDRKLFGIFEAVSSGQMNIDKHAWTSEASELTQFPAQVRIKIRMSCLPLVEEQFKPIIIKNYFNQQDPNLFWFELDQNQTQQLISVFSANPFSQSTSEQSSLTKWGNLLKKSVEDIARQDAWGSETTSSQKLPESSSTAIIKGKEVVEDQGNGTTHDHGKPWSSLFKPENLSSSEEEEEEETEDSESESAYSLSENEPSVLSEGVSVNETLVGIHDAPPSVSSYTSSSSEEKSAEENLETNSDICEMFDKLLQTVGEIKAIQLTQTQKIESLDLQLAEVHSRLKKLEFRRGKSERSSLSFSDECSDSIVLVGGFDGSLWLQDLVSYLPSEDLIRPLAQMNSVRPYSSAVELNGELFVLGGGGQGTPWYDTVESYNLRQHKWVTYPDLNTKKGNLVGATLLGKIFAIGGGNETGCLSEVEVLDPNIGRWMFTKSMLYKRISSAAAALNGALYVAGGYDGQEYLRSVERYDPRAFSWKQLQGLNTRRGCHSLAVLNDKLYAIGGYDGTQMVPTVEVFEPRVGSWTISESMTRARGYLGTATMGNTIYAIGGLQNNQEISDTVECYSEGEGWQLADSKFVGQRCFFSAVACSI
ncbi:hypothetical protein vseg_006691 [Gypsophila vaccaria]